MKKKISVLAIIILLSLGVYYVLIPSSVNISQYNKFKVTAGATYRILSQKNALQAWCPGDLDTSGTLHFNGYTFYPGHMMPEGMAFDVEYDKEIFQGTLTVSQLRKDSVGIAWNSVLKIAGNPIQRVRRYHGSDNVGAAMKQILDSLHAYLENPKNVYDIHVTETRVVDTLLVTTKHISDSYPSNEDVYQLINRLKHYITKEGAHAVDSPMLYVQHTEDNKLQTMVAIPVNKPLPNTNEIAFKRMVPGKILVTEIKGGPQTIRHAFTQMEFYVDDFKRVSPAIPFELLITDRKLEKDTTKWITRIYYPVL